MVEEWSFYREERELRERMRATLLYNGFEPVIHEREARRDGIPESP